MGSEEVDDEGPPPGWPSIAPPQSTPSSVCAKFSKVRMRCRPHGKPPFQSEMAQMVCGTCRRLLKYPKGSRHVQCSSCSTVNFVLEAHEVGIVNCDGCAVLLMYPYSAPSVKCSSCHAVTKVGDHNRRAPWSVQQGQPPPPLNPVH